ncbi:MAG: hypothetical protein ABIO04_12580 [Ferruginibacter sp.]
MFVLLNNGIETTIRGTVGKYDYSVQKKQAGDVVPAFDTVDD